MTTRSAEYLVFIVALVLIGILAIDRHWRAEAANQRADAAELLLIECQSDLATANGRNG